jgi:hypothetical protein
MLGDGCCHAQSVKEAVMDSGDVGDLVFGLTGAVIDRLTDPIPQLRRDVEQLRADKDRANWSVEERLKVLQLDHHELHLRVAALVRLLIAKQLVSADELAALIRSSRSGSA